jgi:hypothetical protein
MEDRPAAVLVVPMPGRSRPSSFIAPASIPVALATSTGWAWADGPSPGDGVAPRLRSGRTTVDDPGGRPTPDPTVKPEPEPKK